MMTDNRQSSNKLILIKAYTGINMKPKNTAEVFLTLMSLFLVCTPSALAEDQVQHQTGIIDTLKNDWNAFWSFGEVLLSHVSYKINHHADVNSEWDNVTTQDDLNFLNNLKAQYPFSEKSVHISRDGACGPAYEFLPEGVTEATVTDNSGNALDSYTVTKSGTGFTIRKGAPEKPDQRYAINLKKLEEFYAIYGKVGQVQKCEIYIKEQIQAQA